jgi:hypothetical protein
MAAPCITTYHYIYRYKLARSRARVCACARACVRARACARVCACGACVWCVRACVWCVRACVCVYLHTYVLLPLDQVWSLVMLGYTYAHHCKFTGSPACHINPGNSQAWLLVFWLLLTARFPTQLGFLEYWKYVSIWHIFKRNVCRI